MSEKINNPNAFPTMEHGYNIQGISTVFTYEGMTLRDYFAAKAMQSMISNQEMFRNLCVDIDSSRDEKDKIEDYISQSSFDFADAMLKERQK